MSCEFDCICPGILLYEDTCPFAVPAPGSPWESMNCVGMNILDELSGPGFVERVHELHMEIGTM